MNDEGDLGTAPRVIEVFADIVCPFTHVGLRRLCEERDRRGRDDVVLRVRSWPLELVNDAPLSHGLVAAEIRALRKEVAPNLFEDFSRPNFPDTTIPALALAHAAYREGDQAGEGVSLALRTALFEEGRDITDPAELAAIAASCEVDVPDGSADAQAVTDDWEEGKRRGVLGSPHFFVDGQGFFCPTLDIEHVDNRIEVSIDLGAFTTFLDAVFGDNEEGSP